MPNPLVAELKLDDNLTGPLAAAKAGFTGTSAAVDALQSRMTNLSAQVKAAAAAWDGATAAVEALQASGRRGWQFDQELDFASQKAKSLGRDLEQLQNSQETLVAEAKAAGVSFNSEGQAIDQATSAVQRSGVATAQWGGRVVTARTEIQRLASAGSQMSVALGVLGGQFGESGQAASRWLLAAGDVGLVLNTIKNEAPVAAAALKSFGLAEDGVSLSTDALLLKLTTLSESALVSTAAKFVALGTAVSFAGQEVTKANVIFDSAYRQAHNLGDGFDDVRTRLADLKLGVDESARGFTLIGEKWSEDHRQLTLLDNELDKSGIGMTYVTGAAKDAADAAETHRLRLLGETDQLDKATTAAKTAADTLTALYSDPVQTAFANLGTATDTETAKMYQLAYAVAVAQQNMAALGSSQTAAENAQTARLRQLGEAPSAGVSGANQHGFVSVAPFDTNNLGPELPDALKPGGSGVRSASNAADAIAKAWRDKVDHEFDNAEHTASKLFDTLHERHLQAINDAEKLAEKEHDAAIQKIQDTLKQQQLDNAKPVTAAEKTLGDIQNAQQLRNLNEAVTTAQAAVNANTDPTKSTDLARQLRDATEALKNFQDQLYIDALKDQQSAADAKAQADADAATTKADADLAAAKAKQTADTNAENVAAVQRQAQFDRALAALKVQDVNDKKTPEQIQSDITALEKKFGIVTDALGFHHIADPIETALQNLKLPVPQVTNVITVNVPSIVLNGRAVSSALSTTVSQTQTRGVRTGQVPTR